MLIFSLRETNVFHRRTKAVVMAEESKYYVVKQKALPEVLLKVAMANRHKQKFIL